MYRPFLRIHCRLPAGEGRLTADEIAMFLGGMTTVWWLGYKFGVVVSFIKNLGSVS